MQGRINIPVASLYIADAALTNDESTWTSPVAATQADQDFLTDYYVPKLCNAYVYEKEGGQTQVSLYAGGHGFFADNVTPDERLVENKASGRVNAADLPQLSRYLQYLDENGGSLDYNFFRSPVSGMGGPDPHFASTLADAATKYDIGIHVFDYDWWDELQ